MRRALEWLNRPVIVLVVLAIVILVNIFLYYNSNRNTQPADTDRNAAESTQPADTAESSATQADEAEYISEVGDIQNGAVDTLADSNDKLRRYDSLTAADVEDLETNYLALGEYRDQAENLELPEGYEDQHEIFSAAIGELHDAAGVAHRVTASPVSATKADFDEYKRHVDGATTSLRQSNEILGQNYKTTEGMPSPLAI